MAYFFPEGSSIQFSTTLATARTVTAATNANPAVLTASAHAYVTNDEVLYTSGWEDATESVYRVTVTDANTFSLQGLNSSNTSFFPSGSGTGTTERLSAWTSIPQVLNISTSGGDARFTTVSPLARRNDINVPTGFNALTMQITMGHDPSLAAYQTMLNISRTLSKVALKMVLTGGGTMYGWGYMNVSEAPQLNRNQANQVTAAVTLLGRAISYAT
ncbi:MAG: hypothetical protein INF98_16695 [Roseomonas sp.]|nr:hypothetical protein [Roseomonas sp.]